MTHHSRNLRVTGSNIGLSRAPRSQARQNKGQAAPASYAPGWIAVQGCNENGTLKVFYYPQDAIRYGDVHQLDVCKKDPSYQEISALRHTEGRPFYYRVNGAGILQVRTRRNTLQLPARPHLSPTILLAKVTQAASFFGSLNTPMHLPLSMAAGPSHSHDFGLLKLSHPGNSDIYKLVQLALAESAELETLSTQVKKVNPQYTLGVQPTGALALLGPTSTGLGFLHPDIALFSRLSKRLAAWDASLLLTHLPKAWARQLAKKQRTSEELITQEWPIA